MGLLRILYRDDRLVAIDKPERLLVHRSRQARDHVFALQLARDQIGQFLYPVHRLDRATSGVLLFAMDREAASAIGSAFSEGRVRKEYLAVVRGHPPDEGCIDHPLSEPDSEKPKASITRFRTECRGDLSHLPGAPDRAAYATVRVFPETGRTHQIRRHLKHLAHPLIGDTTYGKGEHNRFFRSAFGCYRLLLHAAVLTVPHPDDGRDLTILSPVPEDWTVVLQALEGRPTTECQPG